MATNFDSNNQYIIVMSSLLARSGQILRELRNWVTLGRTVREAGLALDQSGSRQSEDVAYLQPLNRHRNILPLPGRVPVLSSTTYIAPNATVMGSVYAAANTYISFGAQLKALTHAIRIGKDTSIGENSILDCANFIPDEAFPRSLNIGNNVKIENNCFLYSCVIDDHVHVGFRSIVLEGALLERGCVIAPNSVVPAGTRIPAYTVWAGNPVAFVRVVGEEEKGKEAQVGAQDQIRLQIQE